MIKGKLFFIGFLFSFIKLTTSSAQELQIFDLWHYEKDSIQSFAFISLSEVYPLSENPDSLAIPDLGEKEAVEAKDFTYFQLDSTYRARFFAGTKITETDKVFIYDYAHGELLTIPVKNLKVVACLNIYGADWPYSQLDYMIGFEIDKKELPEFDKYYTNSLVYVGKKNPFIRGHVKSIIWEKINQAEFPSKVLPVYDTSYAGICVPGDAYTFEMEGLQYFVQDLIRLADSSVSVKRLIVTDLKNKTQVCEKLYYSGESASFAPMDNQWTGRLFKNRSRVIFGLQYVTFGCTSITFLNSSEKDIYIKCDSRH